MSTRYVWGFGSLMDIDKLILRFLSVPAGPGFGSLMDIDKLIPSPGGGRSGTCFGSLMDIDKLILYVKPDAIPGVLVL